MRNIKKAIMLLLAILIIITVGVIGGVFLMNKPSVKVEASNSKVERKKSNEQIKQKVESNDKELIRVDIKGNVVNPNVSEVDSSLRVIDIINIAGGLTENADTDSINLSQKVNDEDVIIIYSREEMENSKTDYIAKIDYCDSTNNSACASSVITFDNGSEKTDNIQNSIININTATIQEFMQVSGIGESKAKSIIEYREANGNFKTIEDIKNVTGIGDNIFDKIKNYITI